MRWRPILAGLLLAVPPTATVAGASPFGINAHTPMTRVLDQVDALGTDWIRIDLVWSLVERSPDEWDWRLYDRIVDDATRRGLKIYATLGGTPAWATHGSQFSGVPTDPDDWRELCYRAAARYRGRIQAWGFWNEPNLGHFWEGSRNEYIVEILRAGAEAVRAADPDALLCAADLAHLNSGDWDDWLTEVIARAGSELDVVTHHVYPSSHSAGDVTESLQEGGDWPWDPPSVREVLQDTGWWGRPLWLTETGIESDRWGALAQANFYGDLVDDWYGATRGGHNWMDRLFFYHIHDDSNYPDMTYGLLTPPPELKRRAAFDVYRDAIRASLVDDAEFVSVSVPAFSAPDRRVTVSVTVRNTGTTIWSAEGNYWLDVAFDPPGWYVFSGDRRPVGQVRPGGTSTFTLKVDSPDLADDVDRAEFWWTLRMRRLGEWYFGHARRVRTTVSPFAPATIIRHPQGAVATTGGDVRFEVAVTSLEPVAYQWRRNSVLLADDARYSGTRTPVLDVRDVGKEVLGHYACDVSTTAGTVTTQAASLTLLGASGDQPRRADDRVDPALLEAWRRFRQGPRTGLPATAPER